MTPQWQAAGIGGTAVVGAVAIGMICGHVWGFVGAAYALLIVMFVWSPLCFFGLWRLMKRGPHHA